ncbi:core-2/I-Branching enzyme domain-containing protein [Ditylenchus destructor]|uniref:Core-2/I-Branching enzyme domain-containing protein n=1 Tax=Ditylenchus destructor TaxID=166010 RepID=A0AAD4R7B0_9BILA|nr:core-2/I-Branching enzyme domain-containing protein [Ditylenchus destructor]
MKEDEQYLLESEFSDGIRAGCSNVDLVNGQNFGYIDSMRVSRANRRRPKNISSDDPSSNRSCLLISFAVTGCVVVTFFAAITLIQLQHSILLRTLLETCDKFKYSAIDYTAYSADPSLPVNQAFVFRRPPNVVNLDCAKLLEGTDKDYIREAATHRVKYKDDPRLPMDCASIKRRNYFAQKSASKEEENFPIAVSRTVFKDYFFLETELSVSYAPQNWYCYALDEKTDETFRARMHSLSACLSNVVITHREWKMDSAGHNMSFSHLECMKLLSTKERKWNYMILLQNHDVALKTNEELVQILQWFGGANDVEVVKTPWGRVNYNLNWTFEHLKLFRDEFRNIIGANGYEPKLAFAKGLVESSFSRPAVEFMVNELNLEIMYLQLETEKYGVDEISLPTLQATDAIGLPGGFTHKCLAKGIGVGFVSRFTIWGDRMNKCGSHHSRHYLCVFGVEDLSLNLRDSVYLFANKLMPEFDFGAISCWHETIFNRTQLDRGTHRLKPEVYKQLPTVRYHAEKKANGSVDLDKFDCHYNISFYTT